MSIHDGHRKRLRQRFLQEGLEHFTDVQVLELVLFMPSPGRIPTPLPTRCLTILAHFPR